jgi:hypothetical protein
MSTIARGRVPFIPQDQLRTHHVYERADDRFRAAARARQALLREAKGWPMGLWPAGGEEKRELGSYLAEDHQDANFITPEIANLARKEIAWREDDALIDTDRLFRNLLSSMPATFNILGELALKPRLATTVMRRLCPDFVHTVEATLFEHSPARRHPTFTADRSAFDALFKITTTAGEHGFVACEVKYTESMHEQPARLRPRYDELSKLSELFVDPNHPDLRAAPLQQMWRQHLLAFAMVKNGLYSAGRFIVIAPTLNRAVQEAIASYRSHLLPGGVIPFEAISFEQVVEAIRRSGAKKIATLLHERYLDFRPVDELILGGANAEH